MQKNNYEGLDTGRARLLGCILAFVGTIALVMRLWECGAKATSLNQDLLYHLALSCWRLLTS